MREIKGKTGSVRRGFTPWEAVFIAHTGVMQSLHKKENLLLNNRQDSLVQRKHAKKTLDFSLLPLSYPLPGYLVSQHHLDLVRNGSGCLIPDDLCSRSATERQRVISLTTGRNNCRSFFQVLSRKLHLRR